MTTKYSKLAARLSEELDAWIKAASRYNDDNFKQVPEGEKWTLGQVYSHLLFATNMLVFRQVDAIVDKRKLATGKPNLIGKLVLLADMLPPIKTKPPEALNMEPPQPDKLADVIEGLRLVQQQLADYGKKLDSLNPSPEDRRKHPALGMLNAYEWIQFGGIHFRHHIRQRKRLERKLGL